METLSFLFNLIIMRKRINTNAICSSDNYIASKRAHQNMLKEKHKDFSFTAVTTPSIGYVPKYKTIKVFGKEITITRDEYLEHCKGF